MTVIASCSHTSKRRNAAANKERRDKAGMRLRGALSASAVEVVQ
jgi:hypothetical protein